MIEILDENLKKVDILRKYTFAQYSDRFRDVGTFVINVRILRENLYLLNKNKQYYVLFDGKVFGKIESVKRNSDSEYEKTIELRGRLSPVLFTERVVTGTLNFKGNTAQLVRTLVENEITKDVSSDRYVNINIKYDNEEHLNSICSKVDKQITGGYVWDGMKPVLEQDKLGLFFVPNITTEQQAGEEVTNIPSWDFTISAGTDRTKGNKQGNTPVVFSQSLSNIERTEYGLDVSKFRNVAYVAGEGEADKRKWYEIHLNSEQSNKNKGWKRKELWIDARDIQSKDDKGTAISQAEYEQLIKQRANEKFAENTTVESYSGTIFEANKQYTYGKDYRIGDFVTIIDKELGISVDVQVTEVIKSWQEFGEIIDIDFTYGAINREPSEQLQEMGSTVDKNKNDIIYLENKLTDIDKLIWTQKVLWGDGGAYMNETQVIELKEAFEEQKNGIVLVWSGYTNKEKKDYWWNTHFVPKEILRLKPSGGGYAFMMCNETGGVSSKYLYFREGYKIAGHKSNGSSALTGASGIKFINNVFVLRYVLGV